MLFDKTKHTYKDTIEEKISFTGKGLDFYTEVKADYLHYIAEQELPNAKHPRLLDVGCGHGYIHPKLLKYGYNVTGVEVAKEVVPLAQKANPDVLYKSYDGRTLPFEDNSFDIVMAICVMHHVPPTQWLNFLNESKRVVNHNGIIVIFEHNPLNPLTRYIVANNEIDEDAVLLSTSVLKKMMRTVNLHKIRTRNILFTPFAHSAFRIIDRKLGWCPFGAQYYTVGKKAEINE
jgi:SAM-dependent methyltransferase